MYNTKSEAIMTYISLLEHMKNSDTELFDSEKRALDYSILLLKKELEDVEKGV